MDEQKYKALIIKKNQSSYSYNIEEKKVGDLPPGELLIAVNYSNINFKDAMSCQGNPSITRKFPHIPGIDACGKIVSSADPKFCIGDDVLVICKPMGLNSWGGFSGFIRIPSSWAMKIDETVNKEYLMAFGTAGFTGALAVDSLLNSQETLPSRIIVSGASGGVGVVSIIILKHLGVKVSALTKSGKFINQLNSLGVDEIITPEELIGSSKQNLALAKWDGAIDVVGGNILSSLIKSIKPEGRIAITGNVESTSFTTNVLPFILRGVSLIGINAEIQNDKKRYELINRLTKEWLPENLSDIYTLIKLDELPSYMESFISGEIFGRVVVKIS